MPSTTSSKSGRAYTPLRQLTVEKVHGKGANPSLLGDPTSLTTEVTVEDRSREANESATTSEAESTIGGTTAHDGQTINDSADHDNRPSGTRGGKTKDLASKL